MTDEEHEKRIEALVKYLVKEHERGSKKGSL